MYGIWHHSIVLQGPVRRSQSFWGHFRWFWRIKLAVSWPKPDGFRFSFSQKIENVFLQYNHSCNSRKKIRMLQIARFKRPIGAAKSWNLAFWICLSQQGYDWLCFVTYYSRFVKTTYCPNWHLKNQAKKNWLICGLCAETMTALKNWLFWLFRHIFTSSIDIFDEACILMMHWPVTHQVSSKKIILFWIVRPIGRLRRPAK